MHQFKPRSPSVQVSLVKWINGYLYWRIQDLYAGDKKTPRSLDAFSEQTEAGRDFFEKLSATEIITPTLSGLDGYIEQLQKQQTERAGLELKLYIEQDPEGKLQQCHPKDHLNCNCLMISQKLTLKDPPDKLSDVARELKINYQTLIAHWKRKCLPLLKDIVKSQGYQPE